jgi:hypothetical protein
MRIKDDERESLRWIEAGMDLAAIPKWHVRKLSMAGCIQPDGSVTARGRKELGISTATEPLVALIADEVEPVEPLAVAVPWDWFEPTPPKEATNATVLGQDGAPLED